MNVLVFTVVIFSRKYLHEDDFDEDSLEIDVAIYAQRINATICTIMYV